MVTILPSAYASINTPQILFAGLVYGAKLRSWRIPTLAKLGSGRHRDAWPTFCTENWARPSPYLSGKSGPGIPAEGAAHGGAVMPAARSCQRRRPRRWLNLEESSCFTVVNLTQEVYGCSGANPLPRPSVSLGSSPGSGRSCARSPSDRPTCRRHRPASHTQSPSLPACPHPRMQRSYGWSR